MKLCYPARMTIPPLEHTLLSAHDPETGRLDARRLADVLAITNKRISPTVPVAGWRMGVGIVRAEVGRSARILASRLLDEA